MAQKLSNVKDTLKKVNSSHPIMVEKHDFSASFYRDKDSKEPFFHIDAKGGGSIDVLKIAACSLAAVAMLSAFEIMSYVQKSRKKKIKKLKVELKAKRNVIKQLKKELG